MQGVSFYTRNGYIQCRVRGQRFTTKIKLPPGHTIVNGIVYGQDSAKINAKLNEIKTIISHKIKDGKHIVIENNLAVDESDPMVKDYARLIVRKINDDSIISKTGKPYSAGSKIQWRQFCNVLNRFDDPTRLLSLDMSGDAKQKKTASDLSKLYFQNLRSWMADAGFKITTQAMIFEKLKVLMSFAEDEYMIRVDKKFRHYKEEVPIVVITPDMVKEFLNSNKPEDPMMSYAYEVSSVVLVTSLRISDAISLTIDDLSDGCIVSTNKKTGANTKSPIPNKVYSMLVENFNKYGRLYTMDVSRWETDSIMANMMPLIFKDIAKGNVTISRLSPDGTTYNKINKPLYEMIRPHMLRKSAITSMIISGVPERFVKHLSGHKGNSKAFERYVAYVEKEYNESIKNYQNNLING